jgi:hypothetical protein
MNKQTRDQLFRMGMKCAHDECGHIIDDGDDVILFDEHDKAMSHKSAEEREAWKAGYDQVIRLFMELQADMRKAWYGE